MGLGALVIIGFTRAAMQLRLRSTTASPSLDVKTVFSAMKVVKPFGRLESKADLIQLSAAALSQGNRGAQPMAAERKTVESGQMIAILDSRDRLQTDLAEAQKQLRMAQIQLDPTLARAKQGEIDALRAEIAKLERKF